MPARDEPKLSPGATAPGNRTPWKTPVLNTLGDLATLTRKASNQSVTDGGVGSMRRS